MKMTDLIPQIEIPFSVGAILFTLILSCGNSVEETAPPEPRPAQPQPPAQNEESLQGSIEGECHVLEQCSRRCEAECALEERDRTTYFEKQRAEVAKVPFKVSINRIYLDGECYSGGDPTRRRETDGISAIVEGELTYTGDDLLHRAFLGGEMFLQFGPDQYREVFAAERSRSYWSRKLVSRFTRDVRGVDPWRSGQTRFFHWESRPISPVYCESRPLASQAFIQIATYGVRQGRKEHPLGFVNIPWDEAVGMAVKQPVSLKVRSGREWTLEPVEARFSKLDKLLIIGSDGNPRWVSRDSVVQRGDLVKAAPTTFPVSLSTSDWSVTITGINNAQEFGGYRPDGEDQYLAVVDVSLTYQPSPDADGEAPPPGKLRGTAFRLETSPGRWQRPATKAMGQLDLSAELGGGGSVSGKIVFPRQRFERPFRIEIKTPDRQTSFLDVFSDAMGPDLVQ